MTESAANLETYTKEKMEDHQHQMNWERGQIDYLGVDSFDNIMRKIDTVIAQKDNGVAAAPAASEPGPPVGVPDQTERQELIVRASPRKRESVSTTQLEECKRSPVKRGFRPRPKPMRGRGQEDHRERFVRVAGARNRQPISDADLQILTARTSPPS